MRKAIALFLIVFLPLQWGWAVAAVYCHQHEVSSGSTHFGHHEHGHAAGTVAASTELADPATDADGTGSTDGIGGHADCGMCKLSSAPAVVSALQLAIAQATETLPRSEADTWPDSPAESLYRPPLNAAA